MERRVVGLDGLRGIAALVVLQMHVSRDLQGGHLAVDFFFMLSGYVMARSYELRLRTGSISTGEFLRRRYRRFVPTMAIGATLGLVAMWRLLGPSTELFFAYAMALLLLPGSATLPYLLNLPAWSIFYELLANALHGTLFARMRSRTLLIVVITAAIGLIGAMVTVGFPRFPVVTSAEMQALVVFRLVASYGLGILIFRTIGDHSPVRVPFALGASLLPAYVGVVALVPFSGWQLAFIFGIAPVILLSGLDEGAPERLSSVLGRLSFPLYAVHFPIMLLISSVGIRSSLLVMVSSLGLASLWLIPPRYWRMLRLRRADPAPPALSGPAPANF